MVQYRDVLTHYPFSDILTRKQTDANSYFHFLKCLSQPTSIHRSTLNIYMLTYPYIIELTVSVEHATSERLGTIVDIRHPHSAYW